MSHNISHSRKLSWAKANKSQQRLRLQACKVAKLFAKHFKVEEQQQALQAACTNIATGTSPKATSRRFLTIFQAPEFLISMASSDVFLT